MKFFLSVITFLLTLSSFGQQKNNNANIPVGSANKPSANEAVATFGEGCFWHAEIVFQSLAGVRDAISGYAGGSDKNPTYESVCSGETGHAEIVQVYYDPNKISYKSLVAAFFASQDPTELNRQGPDKGTQYRSVAFYRNEIEKQVIEAEIKQLTDSKKYSDPIVTQVIRFSVFYPAEDYHQEYIFHHPENPYVQNVSIPDFLRFKKEFKGDFKPYNTVQ
ncbi:MAG: peptide-methionine (S)-S-oxide reductase MsrA [Ferruginibacter sp.]